MVWEFAVVAEMGVFFAKFVVYRLCLESISGLADPRELGSSVGI